MNRRLILAGLAATGGLVSTAFLQVAVAAADTAGPDAFTIGGFEFDPINASGAEGFDPVTTLIGAPPVLEIGGGTPLGILEIAPQNFDVFDPTNGADLGSIGTGETVTDLFGLINSEFTVESDTAADGGSASDLPAVGSVYDALNLGNGYENIYSAIPGANGAPDTVTDVLVTPNGDINLDSLFGSIDAAAPLNPGDAFTGLETGDSSIGTDAFSIDGTTFDPQLAAGGEGFDPVPALSAAPPLLEIGGGALNLGGSTSLPLAAQDFNVFDGTGAGATDVGSIDTTESVTNLLGLTNTEFVVDSVTGTSADLPTVGSVYDAFNFGDGIENVYTAIPGVDGAADTVTDTLVTPLGNVDLSSLFGGFDAIAALDPGDAFTGGLDAATAAASAIDPLAFLGL
jgi:hypothetical protein